ncbi:MAG: histidine ammonia-lyase [Polyangiaceae bacterium]
MAPTNPSAASATPVLLGRPLSLADLVAVARGKRPVALCDEARARVVACRAAIDAVVDAGDHGALVYGVNTGFGALAEKRVSEKDLRALQQNLVRSHACGVGPALGRAEVRAMMVLRAQVVALGFSGVRAEVVDLLVGMLNADVVPRVPSQGSVGASGDLAPLAHLTLALLGEGEVLAQSSGGGFESSDVALRTAGLEPIVLAAKEGLALINGTQYMTALGALAIADALELAKHADVAGAISLEALLGSKRPFDPRLMAVRPHPGQAAVARNLLALLADSEVMESHRNCSKVQDPYSLRCMPQVHGATRDALDYARAVIEREINSVTDNPTVLRDADGTSEVISGGNFHGQPVALALDIAAIAVAELANIAERRLEQLVNPALSSGLTPFLAPDGATGGGLHSGFMIAQVAAASLVSENKVLCHPASVDSIPSSAGREDHVSMGSVGAKKLAAVLENSKNAIAIELMVASAGLDQRRPLRAARGVEAAHGVVRTRIEPLVADRPLYRDIEAARALIDEGSILSAVAAAVGSLE